MKVLLVSAVIKIIAIEREILKFITIMIITVIMIINNSNS